MEAEVFRFSVGYKGLLLFCILVFGAALLLGIALLHFDPSQKSIWIALIDIAVFGFLLWYSLKVWKKSDDYITADGSGLTYVSPKGTQVFISWREIADVRSRDVLQRLEIYNVSGRKLMDLEYQLENFERLRAMIVENGCLIQSSSARRKTFVRSVRFNIFFFVAFVFFSIMTLWGLAQRQLIIILIFAVGEAATIVAWLREVQKVVLYDAFFERRFLLWKRRTLYSDIEKVDINNVMDQYMNSVANVIITLHTGKQIELVGFREGSLSLFNALDTALKSTGQSTTR